MDAVMLRCSRAGCPRKKKIRRDDSIPTGATVVVIVCPWHDDGDFHEERYFGDDGEEMLYAERRKGE